MTVSLAIEPPAVTPAMSDPLLRVAPQARLLVGLGLAMIVAAGLGGVTGFAMPAMIAGAAGAGLVLLAGSAGALSARQTKRRGRASRAMAALLSDDPDPVIVTDTHAVPTASNRAATAMTDLAGRLSDWCVEPSAMVASILSEVRTVGVSNRVLTRKDKELRVSAHRTPERDLIVWRFTGQSTGRAQASVRGLDGLKVPVVTLDGEHATGNAAALSLGDYDGCVRIARSVLRSMRTPLAGPVCTPVTLPSGTVMQALLIPGRDGAADVAFLPSTRPAGEHGTTHVTDFEEIPVALVQLDAQGRIAGTNRLARTLLSLDKDESRFFWQVVEGLGRPVADWLDDAQAGRALGRPEVLRASLSGPETYVQIILRRLGGAGAEGGLVAVISDATELKSLEARFVQSQKMQAIGQLAGGIAHDFNNLLTAISGHCDLLLIDRDRFDPDYNDLLQIHQNANRAAALVRQLLAFSRKQTMKPEILRLESLLEELTHLLTRLVGERINLALSHDPSLSAIRADRRQLEQVIMNLVVNARDAMPMGGTIRIETEAQHIECEQEHGRARIPPGDYALIRVIDEGIGIPADIIDKIFEPFFTTKRLGEGTGLGLSTAYGIVKQMGGYIFAESVEGSGTVFTLYFGSLADETHRAEPTRPHHHGTSTAIDASRGASPVLAHPQQSGTQPHDRQEGAGSILPPIATPNNPARGSTILLVEDEAPVRAFAARALRLQGYQVFEAQDGEQALEFLEDAGLRVDLFVTDVIMPGIDGPGWVTQALAQRPGTPVVFVSGYTEDMLSEALSRIPQSVFLGKPFSLHELSAAIQTQLAC
jgi:two-component system cell cycle sensor histidine kinase/response regulator CckA